MCEALVFFCCFFRLVIVFYGDGFCFHGELYQSDICILIRRERNRDPDLPTGIFLKKSKHRLQTYLRPLFVFLSGYPRSHMIPFFESPVKITVILVSDCCNNVTDGKICIAH